MVTGPAVAVTQPSAVLETAQSVDGEQRVQSSEVSATISDIISEDGAYPEGEVVEASAIVQNTGDVEHTFFVGFGAIGPSGDYYDNDGQTGRAVTLEPGEEQRIYFEWEVEQDAPTGSYGVGASVWKESDRDALSTRLDSVERYDTFRVAEPAQAEIFDLQVDSGEFSAGETVTASAIVENTGESEHTFFAGFGAIGPDGDYYDNNGQTGSAVTLSPGEQERVYFEWEVEDGAPTGEYGAGASVWRESDRDNLQTRLDSAEVYSEFDVSSNVDATVFNLEVENGDYTAGETVRATATIENTGGTEHTFFAGFGAIGPDGEYYDNNGQTGSPVTLAPGERQTVQFEWEVESDAPSGMYGVGVSVWKEDDRDALETRLATAERDDRFRVTNEVSATISDIRVDSGSYSAGDTVDASAIVENTGPTEHTFFVGFGAIGPNGDYYDNNRETGTAITLDPGERQRVDFQWVVEDDAPPGEYGVGASVWQESDRDRLETRLDSTEDYRRFTVGGTVDAQVDGLRVEEGDYSAGDTVRAVATIENTGETEHTFFAGFGAIGPDGEYYDNNGQTGRPVTLEPGESRTVQFEWEVESDAPPGSYGAGVSVWKEGDRDNLETRLATVETADRFQVGDTVAATISDIRVDAGRYSQGDTIAATAVVENTGPSRHTFFVGFGAVGPSGDIFDNRGTTGSTVTLDPGEEKRIPLRLEVTDRMAAGEYELEAAVWKEQDRDELETRLGAVEFEDSITIEGDATAEIVASDVEQSQVQVGDRVSVSATIENTGKSEQTYRVHVGITGPNGAQFDGNDLNQEITVESAASREVRFEWTVPEDAAAGQYDVQFEVETANEEGSQKTLDAVDQSQAFTVGTAATQVEILDLRPPEENAKRGESLPAEIRIRNNGSVEQTYEISALGVHSETGEHSTDSPAVQTVELEPGEVTTVELDVRTQEDAASGNYRTRFILSSQADDGSPVTQTSESTFSLGSSSLYIDLTDTDGEPISDARVALYGPETKQTNESTDGVYGFTNLSGGPYAIVISGAHLKSDITRSINLEETKRITIEAERADPVSIQGTVETPDGTNVPDVEVRVWTGEQQLTDTTSGQGEFSFDSAFKPSEAYTLEVYVDGDPWNKVRVDPKKGNTQFTITLQEAALAPRKADTASRKWLNSSSVSEALGFASTAALEATKAQIFGGYKEDQYDLPAPVEVSTDTSVCADKHVSATTRCLDAVNELEHQRSISQLGSVYGFSAGFMELVNSVKSLPKAITVLAYVMHNWKDVLVTLFENAYYMWTHPGILEDIVEQLPESITETQKEDNPFVEGTEEYRMFANSWYTGYITFFAAESLVPATKVAKMTKVGSKVATKIGNAKVLIRTKAGQTSTVQRIKSVVDGRKQQSVDEKTSSMPAYGGLPENIDSDDVDVDIDPKTNIKRFDEALERDDKTTFAALSDEPGISEGQISEFRGATGEDGAAFVSKTIDEGDPDSLKFIFQVERYGTDKIDWEDWRQNLAKKYTKLDADYDIYDRYIGLTKQAEQHPDIHGTNKYADEFMNRDTPSPSSTAQLNGEISTSLRYARQGGDVTVERDLPGNTDKDFDLYVTRDTGPNEWVEVKRLSPTSDNLQQNIRNNLFKSEGNSVKAKLASADELSGVVTVELVIPATRYSKAQIKKMIKETIESEGDVEFDRVVLRFGSDDRDPKVAQVSDSGQVSFSDSTDRLPSPGKNSLETTAPVVGVTQAAG